MFKKIVIDLANSSESEIIYHGQTSRTSADEFVVNIVWTVNNANTGSIQVIAIFSEQEAEAYDVLATIPINATSGRQTVYSDIDCVGIKIKYVKTGSAIGTANVHVKTTD